MSVWDDDYLVRANKQAREAEAQHKAFRKAEKKRKNQYQWEANRADAEADEWRTYGKIHDYRPIREKVDEPTARTRKTYSNREDKTKDYTAQKLRAQKLAQLTANRRLEENRRNRMAAEAKLDRMRRSRENTKKYNVGYTKKTPIERMGLMSTKELKNQLGKDFYKWGLSPKKKSPKKSPKKDEYDDYLPEFNLDSDSDDYLPEFNFTPEKRTPKKTRKRYDIDDDHYFELAGSPFKKKFKTSDIKLQGSPFRQKNGSSTPARIIARGSNGATKKRITITYGTNYPSK